MKTNPSMPGGHVYANGPRPRRPWQLRAGFWLLLAIAAYYLITEHRAHLAMGLPFLPLLLLAACPLIHLFGHGGHKRHPPDHSSEAATPPSNPVKPKAAGGKPAGIHRHGGDLP